MIVIITTLKYGKSHSSLLTCLDLKGLYAMEISLLFIHFYIVMHITLMSPTLNDPFTFKFPVTW